LTIGATPVKTKRKRRGSEHSDIEEEDEEDEELDDAGNKIKVR
jgi:hypothetical protein